MSKRMILCLVMLLWCGSTLRAVEVGVVGGRITNPGFLTYGFGVGTGFFVPLIKLEVEYSRVTKADEVLLPNTLQIGLKIRPKFSSFSPYVVVGVGADFLRFNLHLSQYEKFSFIGGGLHYYIAGMISLRGDIRLLNYKGDNRTRVTGGIFLHF